MDFLDIVSSVLGVQVSMDTKRKDVEEWDSFMHLQLIMEIEHRYQIVIPMHELFMINSVQDLYSYIRGNV